MICNRRHSNGAASIGEGLHQRLASLGGLDAHQTLIKPTLHVGQMARQKATIKHQLRVEPLIAIGACGDRLVVNGQELLNPLPSVEINRHGAGMPRSLQRTEVIFQLFPRTGSLIAANALIGATIPIHHGG